MSADDKLKVFISYARSDESAFAQELLTGLKLAGFEPYLDQHDVVAGEVWERRLDDLILKADTIVFVVSNGALSSETCLWELRRAEKLAKRILPVTRSDTLDQETPEALKRRQYVFFPSGGSFAQPLEELANALRTDINWVREHTRLSGLAVRWADHEDQDSLLLRGAELAAAQTWLESWAPGAPEPTEAQRGFIHASAAAEEARLSEDRKRIREVENAQKAEAKALGRVRRLMIWLGGSLGIAAIGMAAVGVLLFEQNRRQLAQDAQLKLAEQNAADLDGQLEIQRAFLRVQSDKLDLYSSKLKEMEEQIETTGTADARTRQEFEEAKAQAAAAADDVREAAARVDRNASSPSRIRPQAEEPQETPAEVVAERSLPQPSGSSPEAGQPALRVATSGVPAERPETVVVSHPLATDPDYPPAPVVTTVAGLPDFAIFKDCDECPEMVILPAGTYIRGSPESDRDAQRHEKPPRGVTVRRFAIGRYELTHAEWGLCGSQCEATSGANRNRSPGANVNRLPASDIAWKDAKQYVEWLARKEGKAYRLPTEAEWEYAARAGRTTRYAYGDRILPSQANFRDSRIGTTREVGSYAPTAFGLFDIHGNVWEWVEDCFAPDYWTVPDNSWQAVDESNSAVELDTIGNIQRCEKRVRRGGSYDNPPEALRAARRDAANLDDDDLNVGFRIARDVPPAGR